MHKTRIILLICCLSLSLLLSACGGGGARSETAITTKTKGQELIDLKEAYDKGAISQDEYEDLKSEVMDRD